MDMDIRAEDNSDTNDANDGWQPARIAPADRAESMHAGKADWHDATWAKQQGRIIRVRPATPTITTLTRYALVGCTSRADSFVEVHPDDRESLGYPSHQQLMMCEHQILID